jgi:hypothetical protein
MASRLDGDPSIPTTIRPLLPGVIVRPSGRPDLEADLDPSSGRTK